MGKRLLLNGESADKNVRGMYKPEHADMARKLAEVGWTDTEVAHFLGVSRNSLDYWKRTKPEFKEALDAGKEPADARVAMSLYQRAVGYDRAQEKLFCLRDGSIVRAEYVEHYPPDIHACMFWLKNRRPDLWRDKQEVEMSGNITAITRKVIAAGDTAALPNPESENG